MPTYYSIQIVKDRTTLIMVWFSNDADGVLTYKGKVLIFRSLSECTEYGDSTGLNIVSSDMVCDFDQMVEWMNSSSRVVWDSSSLINTWNLLIDIFSSLNIHVHENENVKIVYDKVFWGNNLPSVTPPGGKYVPVLSDEEKYDLVLFLKESLSVLNTVIAWHP